MVMQSQVRIELVAELPQCPKKHGYRVHRRLHGDQPNGAEVIPMRKPAPIILEAGLVENQSILLSAIVSGDPFPDYPDLPDFLDRKKWKRPTISEAAAA